MSGSPWRRTQVVVRSDERRHAAHGEQIRQHIHDISPHATVLLTITTKDLFRDPNFPDRIYTRHSLTDKNLNLSLLRDNLFRFVAIVRHL
tara:strand:- start:496 stop:765 length:270 start_codon:yes stop_codon:yes gene_type:complete